MIALQAYAKINLTLEVIGRRRDGYHEVASIMQTIDIRDTVSLEPAPDLSLSCDDRALETPDNLALTAARMLRDESGYGGGAHIDIRKAIPTAAGLGGGSSDAAATLRGLNRLWGLDMPMAQLEAIGARVGSDVPFLLTGGTAIALGRGERIRRLPPANVDWLVTLTPRIAHAGRRASKTAALYDALTPDSYTRGALTRKLEARIRGEGDVPPQFLFNAFDDVARRAYPGIERYRAVFGGLGAREIHLTGAGPTMYALMPRRELGTAIHLLLRNAHGWDARLARAITPPADAGDEVAAQSGE